MCPSMESTVVCSRHCLLSSRSCQRLVTASSTIGADLASACYMDVAPCLSLARYARRTSWIEVSSIGSQDQGRQSQAARTCHIAASCHAFRLLQPVLYGRAGSVRNCVGHPRRRMGHRNSDRMGHTRMRPDEIHKRRFQNVFLLFGTMDHKADVS